MTEHDKQKGGARSGEWKIGGDQEETRHEFIQNRRAYQSAQFRVRVLAFVIWVTLGFTIGLTVGNWVL